MTSLIASETTLTWSQTRRFVLLCKDLDFFFFFFLAESLVISLFCFYNHAQNIKKLLKIPYSKSHVSMAVHRVGRTLLLDELDIQELFMNSSKVSTLVAYLLSVIEMFLQLKSKKIACIFTFVFLLC